MASIAVFLSGLPGYSPWGHKELDINVSESLSKLRIK